MEKSCLISGNTFSVSEFEQEFCAKHTIPLPQISQRERLREILLFRNRPHLYNGQCSVTKKRLLTCIPPESGFNVVDVELWFSDRWNPFEHGRDYDFRTPFFLQFEALLRRTPLPSLWLQLPTMENSFYTNGITAAKNCYLVFTSSFNEDCLFSYSLWKSKNLVDCTFAYDCELCFDCLDVRDCYNLRFSEHCLSCFDSSFLSSCYGCRSCYGCVNLSHREYCVFNEQLTKSAYQEKMQELDLGSRRMLESEKTKFAAFKAGFPLKFYFGKDAFDSNGSHLFNTKNCKNSFFIFNSEDLDHCLYLDGAKSSILHAMYGNGSELIYCSTAVGDQSYDVKFSADCWQGANSLEYCFACVMGTGNCFGCVGLKKASYCILNKQYSKDEYFSLLRGIKEQMRATGEYGSYFPASCSPYYYNESAAQEYLPLTKQQAASLGFRWRDEKTEDQTPDYTAPDHINEVDDKILGGTLRCAKSGKLFRIIKPELDFYRKNVLPLPLAAPMERIKSKLAFFNLHDLERGFCAECGAEFETALNASGRPLYCETCYRTAVFG